MAKRSTEQDVATAVGGVALVASILANLKQYTDNDQLRRSVEALQRLVQDWQTAYHDLNGQLARALRANEEQNHLIQSLRQQVEDLRTRAYSAEQRALEAEAALDRASAAAEKAEEVAP